MYLYFCFQHLEIGSSKFLQFYDFDGISFMYFLYLNPLIDLTAVSLPQFVIG